MITLRNNGHGGIIRVCMGIFTNSYNSAMTVIAQDDHLTAGAWAACDCTSS